MLPNSTPTYFHYNPALPVIVPANVAGRPELFSDVHKRLVHGQPPMSLDVSEI